VIRSNVDHGGQISAGPAGDLLAALQALPGLEVSYLEAHARRAAATFVVSDRPELAAVFDRLAVAAADEDRRRPAPDQLHP
jgi:hypothetical protein